MSQITDSFSHYSHYQILLSIVGSREGNRSQKAYWHYSHYHILLFIGGSRECNRSQIAYLHYNHYHILLFIVESREVTDHRKLNRIIAIIRYYCSLLDHEKVTDHS